MRVSTKLYSAVGALAITGFVAAGAGIWYLRTMGQELTLATDKTAMKLDLVNATRARTWEMVAALRGMYVAASIEDEKGLDGNAKLWDAAFRRVGEQVATLHPLLITDKSRQSMAEFEAALAEFQGLSAAYQRLCQQHQLGQVAGLTPRMNELALTATDALDVIKNINRQFLKDSQERAQTLSTGSLMVNGFLGLLLLGMGAAAVFVVRDISQVLVIAVSELGSSARQVSAAANQVSASSQSMAEGSSEQAASLQETSSSSEEVNCMAQKNDENARLAVRMVVSSEQRFAEAHVALQHTVSAMNEINGQSSRISKIIKTIDEIAFQTNILALNAAVEAARAGEAGMGFAVVADEVRNLAQRSAQAARDTAELIEGSIAKSNDGKIRVDEVVVAIRAITEEAQNVKALVEEVSHGGEQEATGFAQIATALSQMSQVTQKNAADAEETAAAAEELNALSESLKAISGNLAALVGTDESHARHGTAAEALPRR